MVTLVRLPLSLSLLSLSLSPSVKMDILRNLLEDPRVEDDRMTGAVLRQDKLGWNPIMTSMKADCRAGEIVELFLNFLETRIQRDQGRRRVSPNLLRP